MRINLALVLVLVSCGDHNVFGFGQDASVVYEGSSPFPACASVPYKVDGLFTGYPLYVNPTVAAPYSTEAPYEWMNVPKLTGRFTYMYMDACMGDGGNYLYFINDWHLNRVGPVLDKCFNRFDFFNAVTQDAVEVRVYGDQHITVTRNGVDESAAALGGAGFASSPNVATPHSIFEFRMFFPWTAQSLASTQSNSYTVSASDPCGGPPPPPPIPQNPPPTVGTECDDPSYLIDEPVMAQLTFGSTVAVQKAPDVPLVLGLDKFEVSAGDRVVARGHHFGEQMGTVSVDGTPAQVLIWTDARILFVVPTAITGGQTMISGDGWSVAGPRLRKPSTAAN